MAASDLIAAAIAAFFISHPPMGAVRDVAPDAGCVPALRAPAATRGGERALGRPPLTRGCAAPVAGASWALDLVRGWIARADAGAVLAKLAAQPRVAVTVAPLPEPPDGDPLQNAARRVIAAFRARDPAIELDRKQLVCLQRALYFEARGEGSLGQAAVAHVALNRVGTRPSRATVCDVVREPGQFAPFLQGEPDDTDLAQADEDATRIAIETAAQVMAGYIPDPSRGGRYFYAPRILKTQPAWAKGLKETARVGGHRFFAEPEPAGTRLARD
jgi:N-acetylmuramoyl-L-alanine amidase